MNENQSGSGNLLDTTDCLEAVGVFKGWKNFFFIIAIVCIGILQACFWLVNLGMIPISSSAQGKITAPVTNVPSGNESGTVTGQEPNNPESQVVPPESNKEVKPNQPVESNGPTEPNQVAVEASVPFMLAAQKTIPSPNEPETTAEKEFLFGITFAHVIWVIRFVDAVLVLVAFLYCLTILFSLKVSMLGRLGGINHITRAFFLSLIMLVLVLPWQLIFTNVVVGAIFTSGEIVKWHAAKTGEMFDTILYYLRFCGYMVLVLLLLILAQIRSARWAKAILRRLEII
jgi:hypothetical protein